MKKQAQAQAAVRSPERKARAGPAGPAPRAVAQEEEEAQEEEADALLMATEAGVPTAMRAVPETGAAWVRRGPKEQQVTAA